MTNQLENKIDKMQKLYEEIKKELCELIGDRTIDLITRYDNGEEDYFSYYIGADQYNLKSVNVNYYKNSNKIENSFLQFIVDLVDVDTEGNIQYLETEHTLEDIPIEYGVHILELVHYTIKNGEIKG